MTNFIGIPFADGEPSFGGANCITLIELLYREELGLEIPKIRIEHAHQRKAFMRYLKEIADRWDALPEPEQYCVVAMAHSPKHPTVVQHFGIYLGNDIILHTLQNVGSHTVRLSKMKPFIKGYYKWRS